MQLAYNLFSNNNISRDLDVEDLFKTIAFAEPYFVGGRLKSYIHNDETNESVITPYTFTEILNEFQKGHCENVIWPDDNIDYEPYNPMI
jgi:hypothetical protein